MQPNQPEALILPTVQVNPEAARNTYDFFSLFFSGGGDLWALIGTLWTIYSVIAFIFTGLFIYGIIYSYLRVSEYSEIMSKQIADEEERWRQRQDPEKGNRRWKEVEAHVLSNNPNDWKLAIIEADVMLEKMLEEYGFAGKTIADRLRSASGRSFGSIEDAWQAHRIRNQIAHGGSDFVLTQKMAQATIIQYRKVFEEFGAV